MRAYCPQYHPIFTRASWLPGSSVALWSTHPQVLLSPWKSHPLEGSCQEAIPLPYPTFDVFSLGSRRHTPPPIGHLRRIRVFMPVASAAMRRTSHPSGSRPRDVSLLGQTSAPGIVDAPENPRFPAVSNRVQRTDRMAPLRIQLYQGSRQRRRTTQPFGGRPSVRG